MQADQEVNQKRSSTDYYADCMDELSLSEQSFKVRFVNSLKLSNRNSLRKMIKIME